VTELAPVTVRRVELVPRVALVAEEAAEALGISVRSFYEHVAPELKVVRRGRLRMYPVRELERWLEESAERALA
jgi:hypothetical protein